MAKKWVFRRPYDFRRRKARLVFPHGPVTSNLSVEDTLVLSELLAPALEDHQFIVDTLSFSDLAVYESLILRTVKDTLGLIEAAESAGAGLINKSVTDNIVLREQALNIQPPATEFLTYLGLAGYPVTLPDFKFTGVVLDNLTLTDIAVGELDRIFVGDSLSFHLASSETVFVELIVTIPVNDTLVFADQAIVITNRNLSASDTLNLIDTAFAFTKLIQEVVSDTLFLTENIVTSYGAEDFLTCTEVAIGTVTFESGQTNDTLILTDLATVELDLTITVTDILFLTDTALNDAVFLISVEDILTCTEYLVATIIDDENLCILQAPFNGIETTVFLPCPILDNSENLISNINLRRSMNGETYTYVKSSNNKVLHYTWVLARQKALELEEFIRYYNSEQIKMLNWKGEIWKVNIINNPVDFVQTHRYEPTGDRTDVTLEFEGVKLSG